MRKTYKYRLMPNTTVENKLQWVLTRCRELSNAALSERRDAYRMARAGELGLSMASQSATIIDQQDTANMSVLELCGVGDEEDEE